MEDYGRDQEDLRGIGFSDLIPEVVLQGRIPLNHHIKLPGQRPETCKRSV